MRKLSDVKSRFHEHIRAQVRNIGDKLARAFRPAPRRHHGGEHREARQRAASAWNVPTVYRERAEHCISRRNIDSDALKVLYRLSEKGFTAYLVGGGVRDLLLGRKPKDFDVSTNAHPQQIRKIFRNCFLIGRRFRLAHIRFGEKVIETSTFRRQPDPDTEQHGELYHRDDNTFGTAEEDARRRDFTINGLFYDVNSFRVIDHVGGLEDLNRRMVRTIGDPNIRFREDPVRMLRAVRFAARLDFTLDPKTADAILSHHSEILKSAPPRLLEEIGRLCAYHSAEQAFRLMQRLGLLGDLFPEIEDHLRRTPDAEVYWRHLAGLDSRPDTGDEPPPMSLMFCALMYPIFLERVKEIESGGRKAMHLDVAHELLQPLIQRFSLPKQAFFKAAHMMESQRRFAFDPQRGGSRRFTERDLFHDALTLRAIHLQAVGESTDSLRVWEQAATTHGHSAEEVPEVGGPAEAPPTGDAPPHRRRRRRRRSRRSFHGEEGSSSPQP